MSSGNKFENLVRISSESIIGNIAWLCAGTVAAWIFGQVAGSWNAITAFTTMHPKDAFVAVFSTLVMGIFIGAIARHRFALRAIAAKDDKIKQIEEAQNKALDDLVSVRNENSQLMQKLADQRDRFAEELLKRERRTVALEHRELDEAQIERYMEDHTAAVDSIAALFEPTPTTKSPASMVAPLESTASAIKEVTSTDDLFSAITPLEAKKIVEIYTTGPLHVGIDGLQIARVLCRKEITLRMDAPESGPISDCEIDLTDDWKRIMNERCEELMLRFNLPHE